MVLSRKRLQKLRAELKNNVTNSEGPVVAHVDKNENVTGKKRKTGKKGSEVNGEKLEEVKKKLKVEVLVEKNKEVNGEQREEKKEEIKKKVKVEVVIENGCDLNKEAKVVYLNNNNNNNNNNDKKKMMKKTKKKKKKKVKKAKIIKVEEEKVEVKLEPEVENGGISEQLVEDYSEVNGGGAKKVYVGGMPYYSTEDDIRSYFGQCGAITDIDCMTFPETGKFRGIAIITFETEEAAESALELDGSDMGGLYLTIQPYKATRPSKMSNFSPPVIEGYYRIYAGNLSWDITEDDLHKFFSDCKISAIRFGEDKETGLFKGYAHVDFVDDSSLNKALKLDQKFVCGRPMKISRAVPKKGSVKNGVFTSPAVKPENNRAGDNSVATPEINSDVNSAVKPEINSKIIEIPPPPPPTQPQENTSGVSLGKLKRRTCYDCGERGHISSDCPKKQIS